MPGNVPKNKQCWMKSCYAAYTTEITYDRKKVKVCNNHANLDGLHWHWSLEGDKPCRRKRCKLK